MAPCDSILSTYSSMGFLIEAFKRLSIHYVGIWSPRIGECSVCPRVYGLGALGERQLSWGDIASQLRQGGFRFCVEGLGAQGSGNEA